MLISTQKLKSLLNSDDVIVIDTRSFKEYSEGHIPGSVNLDLFAFHWIDTSKTGIESFNKQSELIFSFVGITSKKKVVFYDEVSGMLAARGVWMLMYFSHTQAYMLDGGIHRWKKDNLPLETKTNSFKPTKFSGKINSQIIAGYEYIRDNLNSLIILDARSTSEYDGTVIRAARGGHIPKALNIDWNQNITGDGVLKSDDELNKIYQIPKDSEIITYCQGAYRAANTFLALKKIGFTNVKVYLGSWGEWGNRSELPIE